MFHHIGLKDCSSTNAELKKRLADASAVHFSVVTADTQSAGYGRLARKWESPIGNLYASIAVEVPIIATAAELGFVASLSVFKAVEKYVNLHDLFIKWPNDILLKGRKISGIMLESSPPYVIIGVGINVAKGANNSSNILYKTGSIIDYCADSNMNISAVNKDNIYDGLTQEFAKYYQKWQNENFATLLTEWQKYSHKIGDEIRVNLLNEQWLGRYNGLNARGALLLAIEDGDTIKEKTISAGDVFLPNL